MASSSDAGWWKGTGVWSLSVEITCAEDRLCEKFPFRGAVLYLSYSC